MLRFLFMGLVSSVRLDIIWIRLQRVLLLQWGNSGLLVRSTGLGTNPEMGVQKRELFGTGTGTTVTMILD